ncbi:FUSC family protein [Streptomyces sp. XD-27]|uniref:FUSC family protein n=1 Tax=Streptomyces sp. XD-27 TaxID=3062779 RepID=UPI0026F415AE|nr:FUSC family protein [Streptomyces sp. XD-27]WKX73563.1 FUSC family protein [Streptomyces sp. XD-27]
MFMTPDPGRLRLRTSARAVVGVGLAVTATELCGLSLAASITAGLAAMLALFTVADPTVRRQAGTTALLPLAGFPVLAAATALHELPLLRDAAFLAVVFCGVAARRWGPRGNALGIFAFMMFFATQFLHAVPGQLPQLYAAVAIALLAVAGVRFGAWCIERHNPPPAAPAPPGGRRLAHPATRQAFQATAACAFALAVGQALSDERWYWAVGAAWWIFVNTASRGETLVRGLRRVVGTVCGIAAGLVVAVPLHGEPAPTVALVALCVFGIFYTAAPSYSWMMFFVTVMAALLYGLMGVLHPGLLALRLGQTAVGALGAALAVALVLPITTHAATDAWIQRALHCVRRCTAAAARRLAGDATADPAPDVAELELLLARVRLSLAPLLHPLSPLRARKDRARAVMVLLDDCARQVRGLAETAADPDASHDARLTAACQRVEAAVHRLTSPGREPSPASAALAADAHHHPGAERALAHLHGLETALTGLAAPLGAAR